MICWIDRRNTKSKVVARAKLSTFRSVQAVCSVGWAKQDTNGYKTAEAKEKKKIIQSSRLTEPVRAVRGERGARQLWLSEAHTYRPEPYLQISACGCMLGTWRKGFRSVLYSIFYYPATSTQQNGFVKLF